MPQPKRLVDSRTSPEKRHSKQRVSLEGTCIDAARLGSKDIDILVATVNIDTRDSTSGVGSSRDSLCSLRNGAKDAFWLRYECKKRQQNGHTGARTLDRSVISTVLYRLSYTTGDRPLHPTTQKYTTHAKAATNTRTHATLDAQPAPPHAPRRPARRSSHFPLQPQLWTIIPFVFHRIVLALQKPTQD
jgi:hypothetical protein